MRLRIVLITGVAVLAVLVAGVLWFTGRESLDEVDLDRAVADLIEAEDDAEGEASDDDVVEVAEVVDPAGRWVVDTDVVPFDRERGAGSFVGYRIDEELSGRGAFVAVGRTPRVDGEVVIDGSRVTEAQIRADLVGLESDSANRDARVAPLFRDRPVSFTLTEPVDFGTVPEEGQRVAVTAAGMLRIGEVEREVSFELSAEIVGQRLLLGGSTIVTLSDFDVRVPSAPVVLSVSDDATIELQLYLSRG